MKHFLNLLLIVGMTITTAAQETCSNIYPVFSPDGSTLYFCSNRNGGIYHIYTANPDGGNPQRLTENLFSELAPRVSPDGTKILFHSGDYGPEGEIYIVNSDGTGQVRLTNNSRWDGYPVFSPDGQKILFEGWDGSNYPEVFIMDLDGSNRVQITNEPGAFWQSQPQFNPAGDKIYFLRGFNADNYIVMMDPDGSNWVEITQPNTFGYAESYFNFNNDGSRLVFITSEWHGYGGPFDVVSCAADGSDWQRLTLSGESDGYCYTPCYHPVNGMIYYSDDIYNADYIWDIFSMNDDGTNKTVKVTCNDTGLDEPGIQPSQLVCEPNPVTGEAIISFGQEVEGSARFQVFNQLGRSVDMEHRMNKESIIIHRGSLAAGIYLFRVSVDGNILGEGKILLQ